jgi:hypothetical protein
MKSLITFVLTIAGLACAAQDANLWADSLVKTSPSTWVTERAEKFSQAGGACLREGYEFIFYKERNSVTRRYCQSNKWVEMTSKWRVASRGNSNYIELTDDDNKVVDELLIQIVTVHNKKSFTRLSHLDYHKKGFMRLYRKT